MTKNRIFKSILALVLVAAMMCAFAACAVKLSGTYTANDGLVKQSFTFEDDKVEVSAFGIEIEGEYEIKDDKIIITYSIGPLHYDMEKSFEKKGNSIFIDGVEFVKEK